MNRAVIDASVAVKWVVEEPGTADAVALRQRATFIAPDLLLAECANVLWKKARRKELSSEEAWIAARLLQGAEIELFSARPLFERATRLAVALDHPAYDCLYLALAIESECRFVTADDRLLRKLARGRDRGLSDRAMRLSRAAAL